MRVPYGRQRFVKYSDWYSLYPCRGSGYWFVAPRKPIYRVIIIVHPTIAHSKTSPACHPDFSALSTNNGFLLVC